MSGSQRQYLACPFLEYRWCEANKASQRYGFHYGHNKYQIKTDFLLASVSSEWKQTKMTNKKFFQIIFRRRIDYGAIQHHNYQSNQIGRKIVRERCLQMQYGIACTIRNSLRLAETVSLSGSRWRQSISMKQKPAAFMDVLKRFV